MLLTCRVDVMCWVVCLLQCVLSSLGQSGVYLNITRVTRRSDGDEFTRVTSNTTNSTCERWFATNVLPYSEENCTVQCKCKMTHNTYNIRLRKCASEEEILNFENCHGSFLPTSSGEPLYDLSKPGNAQLNVSFLNINQSYCRIKTIAYFNGSKEVNLTNAKAEFNISRVQNGSTLLTWNPQDASILSEQFGSLLKIRLLCSAMTSQLRESSSCVVIKTQGRIVKNFEKEHREIHDICGQRSRKKHTDVMLLYILVGVGSACVIIVILVACYACFIRRRRRLPPHSTPRSSSRTSIGNRKSLKPRSVTKNNGPATPAIHDIIFNELSWDGADGDGGFSNRALADPRVLEVDYGIPIDFGTLPRPESTTSFDSNRNSLSALTNVGEHGQRR